MDLLPASFVACLCESLKYAGTVITAFGTSDPMYASAICLIYPNTIEDISSGKNLFFSALYSTSIAGLSCDSRTTLNGHNLISF